MNTPFKPRLVLTAEQKQLVAVFLAQRRQRNHTILTVLIGCVLITASYFLLTTLQIEQLPPFLLVMARWGVVLAGVLVLIIFGLRTYILAAAKLEMIDSGIPDTFVKTLSTMNLSEFDKLAAEAEQRNE